MKKILKRLLNSNLIISQLIELGIHNRALKLFILLGFSTTTSLAYEILQIPSFDKQIIEGRLNIPTYNFKNKIVIDVASSGPQTYENRRKIGKSLDFKYHNYFSDEFNSRGVAYFSYNTRYTSIDTIPYSYDKVDKEKFFTYTPIEKVKDLEAIIKFLKEDSRLSSCQFILLGWSEGAIIASLVADRNNVKVDALFLAGTPAEDVYSTILWQHSGASSMLNMRRLFDTNKDGVIQAIEYDNGNPRAKAKLGGIPFGKMDINNDSILTMEDFRVKLQPRLKEILEAIEKDDNEWIWNSFFRVGVPWIKEHRKIEANKTRLLRLNIPIYLFHGTLDANAPVEGILEIQKTAELQNKTNIHFFIFPENDHSLEFISWVVNRSMPPSLNTIFEQVEEL